MSNKGFTLIELLVAMVILAVGLLGIGGMQIASIATASGSSNVAEASIVGQNQLEYLKSLPYDSNQLVVGGIYPKTTKKHKETDSFFHVGYTVTALGSIGKTINVTVEWTERVKHSISVSTIRTE